jgi:hypothetical protein
MQSLDVGVGVAAVARRGTDARHHEADVVVVVHLVATIDPDVA